MPSIKCFTVLTMVSTKAGAKGYYNLLLLSRFFIAVFQKSPSYYKTFIEDETLLCFVYMMSEGNSEFKESILTMMLHMIECSGKSTKVTDYIFKVLNEEEAKRKEENAND